MFFCYKRFRPIATIDIHQIGLGDNMMAMAGLYSLIINGFNICDTDCKIYVPKCLVSFFREIYFDLKVEFIGLSHDENIVMKSPYFTPLAPKTIFEAFSTYAGHNWMINWCEAIDRTKTGNDDIYKLLPNYTKIQINIRLLLSELFIYGRLDWRSSVPYYVGLRLWWPIALRLGVSQTKFLLYVKNSLDLIQYRARKYVFCRDSILRPGVTVFPVGKSFQSIPPSFCKKIINEVKKYSNEVRFIIPIDDPWYEQYSSCDFIKIVSIDTIEQLMFEIANSEIVISADSFASHAAQLLRDDFLLILNRDFRENVVHPGSLVSIIARHPSCAPCLYPSRTESKLCPSGYRECSSFHESSVLNYCSNYILTKMIG